MTNVVSVVIALAMLLRAGGGDAGDAEKPWVSLDATGKLVYRTDAQGNRIPDFSHVGYETGIVPLPGTPGGAVVPVKITLKPASGDQTARIQKALDDVAKLPVDAKGFRGAVLLKRGQYEVSGKLLLRASGVVLRGEGSSLENGTVVRDTGKDKEPLIVISGSGKPEMAAKAHRVTDSYVPVGATTLTLDGTAGLKVGDTVLVERASTAEWIHFIGADKPGIDWPVTFPVVRWDRVITAIKGKAISLDAPITTAIESKYGGATVTKYAWPGRIDHVGVEHLVGFSNHVSPTDEDHAWTFIQVAAAQHVFVHDILGQHFAYAAVHITPSAKWVTVQDGVCLDPISLVAGARRYSFCLDGQLCLVRDCHARHGRHDFVANNYIVTGPNVFLDCKAEKAISEMGPHRHWTNGMLFDNNVTSDRISLYHRRNYGRKESKPPYHLGHGWASANCVAWNCTIGGLLLVDSPPGATNWAIGCKSREDKGNGQFESRQKPVAIRSLYEAQLAERKANGAGHGSRTMNQIGGPPSNTRNSRTTVKPLRP